MFLQELKHPLGRPEPAGGARATHEAEVTAGRRDLAAYGRRERPAADRLDRDQRIVRGGQHQGRPIDRGEPWPGARPLVVVGDPRDTRRTAPSPGRRTRGSCASRARARAGTDRAGCAGALGRRAEACPRSSAGRTGSPACSSASAQRERSTGGDAAATAASAFGQRTAAAAAHQQGEVPAQRETGERHVRRTPRRPRPRPPAGRCRGRRRRGAGTGPRRRRSRACSCAGRASRGRRRAGRARRCARTRPSRRGRGR